MATNVLLPATPDSVTAARRFVRAAMQDMPLSTCEIVELLVSELATNAVVHARSEFQIRVLRAPGSVRVEVVDAGAGDIAPRTIADNEAHGRGLRIVGQLADEWGVLSTPDSASRTVWFQVSTSEEPAAAEA